MSARQARGAALEQPGLDEQCCVTRAVESGLYLFHDGRRISGGNPGFSGDPSWGWRHLAQRRAGVSSEALKAGGSAGGDGREAMTGLLIRVRDHGDREAFGNLFRFFAPRVKSYLARLGASAPEADELAQDVMVTVWQKAASFDERQAAASTWIFTIARNRRIDLIRRQRKPELDPNDPLFQPEAEPSPDAVAIAGAREVRLREAMKALPQEQRQLLQEAFFAGRSHRDIARDSNIPLGTVKSRLRLAFQRLKSALDGEV